MKRTDPILVDNSLSLVNRTGAYFIARDICAELVPSVADVRHWRLGAVAPEGLARKILARLMMFEISWLKDSPRFRIGDGTGKHRLRLFLDPLYVLRSRLEREDIVLCHDIGPLTHGALYHPKTVENYRVAYDGIARKKPGMVFVSDWTKERFEARFGSDFRFLKTIPLYMRSELLDGPAEPLPGLEGPFFLTVGAFETRKNQSSAILAYHDSGLYSRGVRFVLCGAHGSGHEEILECAARTPGVIVPGYVPDAQLRWLYRHAEAFVLPSLLEGFGMPALEAAYMGLLPIVSKESALVEAVDGICLQVDPMDRRSIGAAMEQALARTDKERSAMSELLHRTARRATREKYFAAWRDLLEEEDGTAIDEDRFPAHPSAAVRDLLPMSGPLDCL